LAVDQPLDRRRIDREGYPERPHIWSTKFERDLAANNTRLEMDFEVAEIVSTKDDHGGYYTIRASFEDSSLDVPMPKVSYPLPKGAVGQD
jgi:hypothetical protein